MGSLNAELVAQDVLETVRKGKKLEIGKIIRKHGYSKTVSEAPTKVTRTKTYLAIVKPILPQLERERQRIITAMGQKDLSAEKYATLVTAMDILTKNSQLLGGKATENIGLSINISEAIAKRNAPIEPNKDTKQEDSQ